ncbi:hypothetical protein bcgnr5378_05410 [Bacillus cereus]|uniref:Uncharacterized protein n=1 Tax=Bacillus cereus TaxID=1396 RepID=A0A164LCV7_BACCE|nr:hypothetical protein [Bacillus cereus]KZD55679.1 hypothetical protein B4088_5424 [Bacillus cereus]
MTLTIDRNAKKVSKLDVIKDIGDILVVTVYAADEGSRVYGDIHTDKSLVLGTCEDNGDILQGYGVLDKKTHQVLDPFESWYDSLDEALEDIKRNTNND